MKKLGLELKQAREKAELSQGDMAKAMGYSTPQFVSNWERGLCALPARKGLMFCKLTGMKPAKLRDLLVDAQAREIDRRFGMGKVKKEKAAAKQVEA